MATASGSEQGWQAEEKGRAVPSLLVQLRQRTYVLPWNLFLFAEGTEAEIRVAFHTHVLTLQGTGLSALLEELAFHSVVRIIEPDRTAKFSPAPGPHLTAVSIRENL